VSFHQCSILIFIYTLLLAEGQKWEAVKRSKKKYCFGNLGALGRKAHRCVLQPRHCSEFMFLLPVIDPTKSWHLTASEVRQSWLSLRYVNIFRSNRLPASAEWRLVAWRVSSDVSDEYICIFYPAVVSSKYPCKIGARIPGNTASHSKDRKCEEYSPFRDVLPPRLPALATGLLIQVTS
jgi:hypothetical protein